jgi:hypothetical protein
MAVEETLDRLDLIVLAGCAGVEHAAKHAGHAVTAPLTPGRMDRKRAPDVDRGRQGLTHGLASSRSLRAGRHAHPRARHLHARQL